MKDGFDDSYSCCVASFSGVIGGDIWVLGDSVRFLSSAGANRITVSKLLPNAISILGTPQAFAENMRLSTQISLLITLVRWQ
jgi:hypothetical protein